MMRRISAVVLLCCGMVCLTAEQLRIVVGTPDIVASTDEAADKARIHAQLWQTYLCHELAKHDLFVVLEREDISRLAKEWDLRLSRGAETNRLSPAWLAADCLVVGKLALTNQQCSLTVKLLNAEQGATEEEWVDAFPASAIEQQAGSVVRRLQKLALAMLARRDIHTLVSVLDFENLSPLERNRWLEVALARRLRGALRRQPGVLVLEREDVNALFEEVRLRGGGLTTGRKELDSRWNSLRQYFVISGRLNESQPEGQPLAFSVEVRIQDLATDTFSRAEHMFVAAEMAAGLSRLERQLTPSLMPASLPKTSAGSLEVDRSGEALELAGKAIRLMGISTFRSLDFIDSFCWQLPPHAFSSAAHPHDATPARRAAVLRAIRYLKTAQMLDERNVRIKVLLSSLLADRSAEETGLAVELAEEIAWQFPQYQRQAWWFVCEHSSGEKRRYYRELIMRHCPGTYEARLALLSIMQELVEAHRAVPDLGHSVEQCAKWLELSLSWGETLEGAVLSLFDLTQLTGRNPIQGKKRYELRDAASRERGAQVLEEMLRKFPRQAFYLTYYWMYYWDYRTDKQDVIDTWIRRTSDAALHTDRDPWVIGVRVDPWRLQLARRLMEHHRHREALSYLELVSNYHSVSEATFLIGECAFALGDYERALQQFQTFGADHREAGRYYQAATTWAEKCRAKLRLSRDRAPAPEYATRENKQIWNTVELSLPAGTISAMQIDGPDLWVGVRNRLIWADHNVVMLENDPNRMKEALKEGGLVRFNPEFGTVTSFEAGRTISHPWVTCLAAADGRIWVGTFGKGIDVFDKATATWSNLGERDGLPSNYVRCLEPDDENLWVATGRFAAGGMARLRLKTRGWQAYLPGDFPDAPPPTAPVRCMKRVADRLWCTMPKAIYSYDIRANRWSQRVSGNYFTSIAVCANRIWFGADQFSPPGPLCGIEHCNLQGEDWRTLRQVDGLPDLAVTAMAENDGKLLLGSYGFMLLDPVRKTFITSDLRKMQSSYSYVVGSLLAAHGRLWMSCRDDNRLRFANLPLQ